MIMSDQWQNSCSNIDSAHGNTVFQVVTHNYDGAGRGSPGLKRPSPCVSVCCWCFVQAGWPDSPMVARVTRPPPSHLHGSLGSRRTADNTHMDGHMRQEASKDPSLTLLPGKKIYFLALNRFKIWINFNIFNPPPGCTIVQLLWPSHGSQHTSVCGRWLWSPGKARTGGGIVYTDQPILSHARKYRGETEPKLPWSRVCLTSIKESILQLH